MLAFDNNAIKKRVRELTTQIDVDYRNVGKLHLVGILPEGYQLIRDVSRRLATDHTVDFVLANREPVLLNKRPRNRLTHEQHVLIEYSLGTNTR